MTATDVQLIQPRKESGGENRIDQSYRTFLADLEEQGELIRFKKPVHPTRNMSAVEWKTYSELGRSSLFTNIEGHPGWSACSQIVADRRKWAIGLGFREDSLLQEISHRLKNPIASTRVDGASAPVKEIRFIGADADLNDLPAATVSARDSGRYIPSGITFVKDPDGRMYTNDNGDRGGLTTSRVFVVYAPRMTREHDEAGLVAPHDLLTVQ